MSESLLDGRVTLHSVDCREVLKTLADNSIDSIVTDPPYSLVSIVKRFGADGAAPVKVPEGGSGAYARASSGFMGKQWDTGETAFAVEFWAECLRVLKPGGHVVAFSGTRTYHRMACAIEDAGFEIRDQLQWIYGSGFPKSHDVSKGIDKARRRDFVLAALELGISLPGRSIGDWTKEHHAPGEKWWKEFQASLPIETWLSIERRVVGQSKSGSSAWFTPGAANITAPATDAAREWAGWGTALKPATEPVLFGAKPLQVTEHLTILLAEITARFIRCPRLNCNANDAEASLNASLATLLAAASSVLDNAKISSLASIEVAPYAAAAFTFNPARSNGLIRTKDCSALSHVRPNGRADKTSDQPILAGEAEDIEARLTDISMSVMMGDTSASIASSWLGISTAILSHGNTFTIETALKLTIALRTLNSSLTQITSSDIGNLSPNCEPICFARKPLIGTVAANVLAHGTGAINIDGCRVALSEGDDPRLGANGDWSSAKMAKNVYEGGYAGIRVGSSEKGRWPANIIHDGSDEVIAAFPDAGGGFGKRGGQRDSEYGFGGTMETVGYGDEGSAARFFYTAKADANDRIGSRHPTVKPVDLMQWLCRLVTPKGGTILDPFAGTGTTGEAAFREGFNAVLIEREEEYQTDIRRRMELCMSGPHERKRESIKAKIGDLPFEPGSLFHHE